MAERLLFVCPDGHVFRSLATMKVRKRVCPECNGVTPNKRGRSTIEAARRLASGTKAGRQCIQVFAAGRVIRKPVKRSHKKKAPALSAEA